VVGEHSYQQGSSGGSSSSRLTAGVEARVMHHGEEPRLAAVRQRVRDANR
jgi:hypothetical protein